jgi:23S rRNA pseudouridine1911/1915/1917 synthase
MQGQFKMREISMPEEDPSAQDGFEVGEEAAGQRLDRFLATHLNDISRTHVQALIDEGRVLVNGRAKKPSYKLEAGETVEVKIPPPPLPGVEAENIPLDILYEDADVAVVNKPAGMIVHPGAGADSGTLVAALLYRFEGGKGLSMVGGPLRPGIVHRIDKGTSGALLIARTDMAHLKLVEDFRERRIEKTYVALLHGKLKGESGRIELPISRDLRRRSRMTARRREGREARTDWKMRMRVGNFSLIEADLHTGRTHQIRVHFSAQGCPVVGDTVYGSPRQEKVGNELMPVLERNFLHAARIAFTHPRSGKRIECRAPLPRELVGYVQGLGRTVGAEPGAIDAALRGFL